MIALQIGKGANLYLHEDDGTPVGVMSSVTICVADFPSEESSSAKFIGVGILDKGVEAMRKAELEEKLEEL